jgi:hypothetical protein
MIMVEKKNGNRDIRDVIIDAISKTTRDQDAAHQIGIYPSTLSHWIPKLGIKERAQKARETRAAAA